MAAWFASGVCFPKLTTQTPGLDLPLLVKAE